MAGGGSRFRDAEDRAGRNRDASRAAVAIMTAGSRLAREIERSLSDADLTLPQFNVLMVLAASDEGHLPMHTVIERLISTPSNLSFLSTRMAERGLVTKHRSDEDARVVVMAITESGWDAVEAAMPLAFATEKALLQEHRRSDLRDIVRLLRPLIT